MCKENNGPKFGQINYGEYFTQFVYLLILYADLCYTKHKSILIIIQER